PIKTNDAKLAAALKLLRDWDHRTASDSPGAALYEVWTAKHLGKATVARAVPQAARATVGNGDLAAVMMLLEHPDASLGANPVDARDEVLTSSLLAAYDEVAAKLGPDPTTWAWGK